MTSKKQEEQDTRPLNATAHGPRTTKQLTTENRPLGRDIMSVANRQLQA